MGAQTLVGPIQGLYYNWDSLLGQALVVPEVVVSETIPASSAFTEAVQIFQSDGASVRWCLSQVVQQPDGNSTRWCGNSTDR